MSPFRSTERKIVVEKYPVYPEGVFFLLAFRVGIIKVWKIMIENFGGTRNALR